FLHKYAQENERPAPRLDAKALRMLQSYGWPGNVRELENYVERALVLATEDVITEDLLPPHVLGKSPVRWGRAAQRDLTAICAELVAHGLAESAESEDAHARVVSLVEKELIQQVLRQCHGVQTKTATRLGINRNTLHKKIDEYGLQDEARA
ncbi:MAG: helix-turn-helix domain-containing protein, partial [Planctomycetaceae bacterium]